MSQTCAYACAERVDTRDAHADTCAIVLAGGSGTRFGDPRGKQFVELAGLPMLAWSVLAFDRAPSVQALVVVCPSDRVDEVRRDVLDRLDLIHEVTLAAGGATRQDSVFAGLMATPDECELVAIHDGARPLIEQESIEKCLAAVRDDVHAAGAICAARVTDTIKVVDAEGVIESTPDRSLLWSAQTPQVFWRKRIVAAHEAALLEGVLGTDDASLLERRGERVLVVETPRDNLKVTLPEDLALAEAVLRSRAVHEEGACMLRIGHGYDVHQFAEGRRCILGGVDVPSERGLLGHSDADVLAHAVADAVLGAARLGDIGTLFPDNDPAYEGADSLVLLSRVASLVRDKGFAIVDVDCTVAAQAPKLAPYRDQMRANLAESLGVSVDNVGVKATTTEHLGFVGRKEGIAAWSVALLEKR